MTKFLLFLHNTVWGPPAMVLILGVGLFISACTGFPQLRLLTRSLRLLAARLREPAGENGISSRQALCTALAATVGTGNIVGVAGAICLGGPGAVFWMWVCAFIGMAVKYAEAALAVHYRVQLPSGIAAGPMYMISRGMGAGWRPLAAVYCVFGMLACFGVGNAVQINAVQCSIRAVGDMLGLPPIPGTVTGMVLMALTGWALLGGAKQIAKTAECLVPAAAILYIFLCVFFLVCRRGAIPDALQCILRGAFHPRAVTGGVVGSSFRVLRVGCARGIFSNEAGMGTASIAHGSAEHVQPAEQGMIGMLEVFADTMVICTMTALVILCSGIPIPYGVDAGGMLTGASFASEFGPGVTALVYACIGCFAFATVLGWSLYGGRCAEYLFGGNALRVFFALQTAAVFPGAVLDTQTVWCAAEVLNGLMAFPNLIALAALSPELVRLTKEYGGTYANFHQRKPL